MGEKLSPVKISIFRKFLEQQGLKYIRTKGDHEIWSRKDLKRPVIFPIKKKDIYMRVIVSNLRTLGISTKEFKEQVKKLK